MIIAKLRNLFTYFCLRNFFHSMFIKGTIALLADLNYHQKNVEQCTAVCTQFQ